MPDELLRIHKPADVVFVFTGQSSQYAGMGSQLFHTSKLFREHICSSDTIGMSLGFPSFIDLIINPNLNISVHDTIQSQLALAALELALAALWRSWDIHPAIVIGHSLGEYAALCTAGALSQTDTLYLVGSRAQLINTQCKPGDHKMVAIQLSVQDFRSHKQALDFRTCEIACVNGPKAIVVGGPSADIETLIHSLNCSGAKVTQLSTQYAFHSAQMDTRAPELETLAQSISFSPPRVPIASTFLGSIVKDGGVFTAQYLARQVREPVQFIAALAACEPQLKSPNTIWLETGPRAICLSMIRSSYDIPEERLLASLNEKKQDWMTLSTSISRAFEYCLPVSWQEYHREYEECLNLLELPTYAFDLRSYWIQYEGDWSIRKAQQQQQTLPTAPPLLSVTLQDVKSERLDATPKSVTFTSDLSSAKIRSIIRGHLVNGQGLCPSSVYADMAMTAASYLWNRVRPNEDAPALNVSNMEVSKPLIVHEKDDGANHLVIVQAVDMPEAGAVQIIISSSRDEETEAHATSIVKFGNAKEWLDGWMQNAYLYQSRIDHLIHSATQGRVHRILKPMIYKLFASLVKYDESFQGMQEIFLDSRLKEATANIILSTQHTPGAFYYSPHLIDSLAHLSGFALNGSHTTPEDTVYISHGWRNMRLTSRFKGNATYKTYVRVQPVDSRGLMAGDVHIFEGDRIVGAIEGLKFQTIKKSVLGMLLPDPKTKQLPGRPSSNHINSKAPAHTQNPANLDDDQVSFHCVLDILASELCVHPSELREDVDVHDLGLDSISSISVLARLRQSMRVDLPSSLFATYPTVAELRSFLRLDGQIELPPESYTIDTPDPVPEAPKNPRLRKTSDLLGRSNDLAHMFRTVVAEEAAIDVTEIELDTEFSDLGVDSILSLSILGVFAEKTNTRLPPSFMHDHPRYRDASAFLRSLFRTKPLNPPASESQGQKPLSHVQLQFASERGLPTLFLLPDGSGSAGSYANIPKLHTELSIIAFNSPFQHTPQDYDIPLEAVARLYVSEVLKLQTQGPYLVGGWSIGGVYAYEIATQLVALGHEVKGVILIDSACPLTLSPLPVETLMILRRVGTFDRLSKQGTNGSIPKKVQEHFVKSIAALKNYRPEPLPTMQYQRLQCWATWAQFGVLELMERTGGEEMVHSLNVPFEEFNDIQRWLLISREDLGANGWGTVVPSGVNCVSVEGDHFSIMRQPAVCLLDHHPEHY